jgi:sortase A
MEYRLKHRRVARRSAPAALVVVLLAGIGLALLADDAPSTSAILSSPPPTTTSPALVEVDGESAPPVSARATTVAPAPATTVVAPPTSAPALAAVTPEVAAGGTLPEQPAEPIAPPSDPRADEEQIELGSISIPKLEVHAPLLEGIRLTTLDNGPGHWPGSAMPGQVGNVVVAAHRTSHGGPFRHIDQLVAGDFVEFTTPDGLSTYVVTGTQIVEPDAIWIVDPTETPTATLFACHPAGSVSQRIVVNLELAS